MFGKNVLAKIEHRSDGQSLVVNSIFLTVQGEGPFAGRPAVFVRLTGCNLKCHFCFGWFPNSGRQPFITMATGPKKKLGKIKRGDRLLTLDSKGALVETTVREVLRREVDQWVRVWIEGTIYYLTSDHPFFTSRGLVAARNLRRGDDILHCESNDVISWKKMGARNPMKDPAVAERSRASKDYVAVGKRIALAIKKKKKKGTYAHSWSRLTISERAAAKAKIAASKIGELNPNFNPESKDRNFRALKYSLIKKARPCARCGKKGRDVHHKDHNRENDKPTNFEILCHSCHSEEHQVGYNFWKSPRKDGKVLHAQNGRKVERVQFVDRFSKPPSLRVRPLPVVNLSCHPHATYLADGMWVKNCDTEFEKGEAMPIDAIAHEVVRLAGDATDLVVLTGGEPLRQQVIPLINLLAVNEMHTQIETAGTVWPPAVNVNRHHLTGTPLAHLIREHHCSLVCSPKTPKVHEQIEAYCEHFKYILRYGEISEDDGLPARSTQNPKLKQTLYRVHPENVIPTIWVQPCAEYRDDGSPDVERTKQNERLCATVAMHYGYRVSLQLHKYLEIP